MILRPRLNTRRHKLHAMHWRAKSRSTSADLVLRLIPTAGYAATVMSDFPVDGCVDYTGEWLRNQSFSAKSMRVCQAFLACVDGVSALREGLDDGNNQGF
jgi:hypothetical protein